VPHLTRYDSVGSGPNGAGDCGKGKGGEERGVPIEAELLSVVGVYRDSRVIRFSGTVKRKTGAAASPLLQWPTRSTLFVGCDGERITQGGLQSRIKRAIKRAGPDAQPVPGVLLNGLRNTYATRARQLRCQRLHANETARPRICDHLSTRCIGQTAPH